jgi:hypothetical protein
MPEKGNDMDVEQMEHMDIIDLDEDDINDLYPDGCECPNGEREGVLYGEPCGYCRWELANRQPVNDDRHIDGIPY